MSLRHFEKLQLKKTFHPIRVSNGLRLTKKSPLDEVDSSVIQVQHGNHIFIYNNVRTNQVIYSLTRTLNNHAALEQLPYLGKKTKPASLRKDLWRPMAMVEFPSSVAGREAYRRLREFRRLHEHAYPLDLITVKEGRNAGSLMSTKQRGKVLMDQKANTIADLAAVLLQFERGPDDDRVQRKESSAKFWTERRKQNPQKFKRTPLPAVELAGVDGVRIQWADPVDAEYARSWPEAVAHHHLPLARHSPAFPGMMEEPRKQDHQEGVRHDSVTLVPERPDVASLAQSGAGKRVPDKRKEMLFPEAVDNNVRIRPRPKPTKGFRGQGFRTKASKRRHRLRFQHTRPVEGGRERIGAASWIERR